jgi:hypothetical protein
MRCPECAHNLLQKSGDKLKVRVPILVFDALGETCLTSCPRCHAEIPVPVTLAKSAIPAHEPTRLVLRRS